MVKQCFHYLRVSQSWGKNDRGNQTQFSLLMHICFAFLYQHADDVIKTVPHRKVQGRRPLVILELQISAQFHELPDGLDVVASDCPQNRCVMLIVCWVHIDPKLNQVHDEACVTMQSGEMDRLEMPGALPRDLCEDTLSHVLSSFVTPRNICQQVFHQVFLSPFHQLMQCCFLWRHVFHCDIEWCDKKFVRLIVYQSFGHSSCFQFTSSVQDRFFCLLVPENVIQQRKTHPRGLTQENWNLFDIIVSDCFQKLFVYLDGFWVFVPATRLFGVARLAVFILFFRNYFWNRFPFSFRSFFLFLPGLQTCEFMCSAKPQKTKRLSQRFDCNRQASQIGVTPFWSQIVSGKQIGNPMKLPLVSSHVGKTTKVALPQSICTAIVRTSEACLIRPLIFSQQIPEWALPNSKSLLAFFLEFHTTVLWSMQNEHRERENIFVKGRVRFEG